MTWGELETGAPEITRLGKERFDRVGVALLGTLRKDGSPRISPVEPYLVEGELLFGAMSWSGKAHDLLRDPRCALHSAVCDPDNPDGELKLYGRASEAEGELRTLRTDTWWAERPPEEARVFSLRIQQAAYITWDAERGLMTLRRWSPKLGAGEVTRPYP
jgi:pyridoxamine 5'-phosphate oxidase-like protein